MATKIKYRNRYVKSKRRGGARMSLPLAVVAGFAGPVSRVIDHARFGIAGQEGAVAEFSRIMTGYNPYSPTARFEFWRMRYGLLPVLVGLGVHKLAGMVGLNRAIARAGIPLVRI